ncbi:hypothetical protein N0V90_001702 [Kalmusia sp. IMI 367209]|nr:hypothetical protein N0V90_001702 [Kalmusia sp. IMI 367209]
MPGPLAPAPAPTSTPQIKICDQFGDPPLEPVFLPLARALILLDDELIRRVQKFYQKRTSSADEARKAKNAQLLKDCIEIKRQWKDINSGKCNFTHLYMKSDQFIPIWAEGLKIIKEAFVGNASHQSKKRSDFEKILYNCDTLASQIMSQMIDIAHQGLLDLEVLYSIQARWIRLDEVLKWYYDLCNEDADEPGQRVYRISLTWKEVRGLIQPDDAKTKSDKELIQIQPAGNVKNETEPGVMIGLAEGKHFNAFIFWLAFFSCAVISTALFALGYGRSLHLKGTTNDPDFWFLIQATCIQILGLIVSALVEKKRDGLPAWRWCLPTAIAGACAMGSIPLYLLVPKEWSSFLSGIAGATQTFMALQYFLL